MSYFLKRELQDQSSNFMQRSINSLQFLFEQQILTPLFTTPFGTLESYKSFILCSSSFYLVTKNLVFASSTSLIKNFYTSSTSSNTLGGVLQSERSTSISNISINGSIQSIMRSFKTSLLLPFIWTLTFRKNSSLENSIFTPSSVKVCCSQKSFCSKRKFLKISPLMEKVSDITEASLISSSVGELRTAFGCESSYSLQH